MADGRTCQQDTSEKSFFNNVKICSIFYLSSFQFLQESHMKVELSISSVSQFMKPGKIK